MNQKRNGEKEFANQKYRYFLKQEGIEVLE